MTLPENIAMNLFVLFFWFAALIAAAFLIYSITNRHKLHLNWHHPRILVEGFLFILFLLMGWVFIGG
jgi:hypothetical protein